MLNRKRPAMLVQPLLRRITIKVSIKQTLHFFNKVDSAGIALGDEFEHWQKGATSLMLKSFRSHSRLFLTSKELVYHQDDGAHSAASFERAAGIIRVAMEHLELPSAISVAVALQATRATTGEFSSAVEMTKKLSQPTPELTGYIGDIKDIGIRLKCADSDGGEYLLSVGPMSRGEWFSTVDYSLADPIQRVFETEAAFEEYKKNFSDVFLYIESTYTQHNIERSAMVPTVLSIGTRGVSLALKLSTIVGAR